jgi:hypothetical protein
MRTRAAEELFFLDLIENTGKWRKTKDLYL